MRSDHRKIAMDRMKYWETIADKLSNAGWSLGWVSAVDSEGRTISKDLQRSARIGAAGASNCGAKFDSVE
jgi:hypothetical protein